jgi:hypothetical protein
MTERREFVRRAIERLVVVGDGVPTFMQDISAGGLSLRWVPGVPVQPGIHVAVELPLGRSRSRIKTACIVRAMSRGDGDDSARVHLEFVDRDPSFRAIVAELMGPEPIAA